MAQQTILGGSGVLWSAEKVKINSNFAELYGRPAYSNLTSFVAQTAWRLFYSNADGDVIELALGADGTYLKSNGASAAPTFATPDGGSMVYPGAGIPVSTGSAWGTSVSASANGQSLLAAADYAAMRTLLDLEPGVDYDSATPSTLALTSNTSVTEAQLLANKYISNYGASGGINVILPAVSYNISRTVIVEAAQIIKLNPPSGELFDLSGTLLDANDVVDSPTGIGAVIVATRVRTGASTWRWSLDVVRGTWVDSGASD